MAAESPSVTSRPLMDFVNRYHGLRTHHDTEGQLIEVRGFALCTPRQAYCRMQLWALSALRNAHLSQDIVLYCQSVETNLQIENADLKQALKNLQLDFEDATRSRRDMQQQLGQIQKHTINLEAECDSMKVCQEGDARNQRLNLCLPRLEIRTLSFLLMEMG